MSLAAAEQMSALKLQAAQARVAMLDAKKAQDALAAGAKLKATEELAQLRASAVSAKAAQDALAASSRLAAQEAKAQAASAKAAADANLASAKAAAVSAAAQVAGMVAIGKAINDKNVADAKSSALSAKAQKDQAQAQLASAKAAESTDKLARSQEKKAASEAKSAKASTAAASSANKLGEAMMGAAQSSTSAGGALGTVQGVLAKLGPEGQAAAVVLGIVTIAVTATAGALMKLAETAIDVISRQAGLIAVFGALGRGAASGTALLGSVNRLKTAIPGMSGEIDEWGKSLINAGLSGVRLENALKAVAAANALLGPGAASAAEGMIKELQRGGIFAAQLIAELKSPGGDQKLRQMGLSTKELAAAMGMTEKQFKRSRISADQMQQAIERALIQKGKGPLEAMALTWPSILAGAKAGILSLFDKLGGPVKTFMKAIKGLFGEFNKGGGVINAIKPTVTAVMTTLFSWATKAVGAIRGIINSFKNAGKSTSVFGGAISVLKAGWAALKAIFGTVAGALKPIIGALKAIFSNAVVLRGIRAIFTVIATVITIVVVAIGVLVGAFALLGGIVAGVVGAIAGAWSALAGFFVDGVNTILDTLSSLVGGASAAGGSIVDGLVGGLDIGAFVGKMAGMAKAGLAAFKGVLGIASPSKVMGEMGDHTVAGFTNSVDDGASDAQASMAKMAAPPKSAKAGAGKGGGETHLHFHYTGPADQADDFFERARKWLETLDAEGPTPATT